MTMQDTPLTHVELTLERDCPLVICGKRVLRGERVATASRSDRGDIHSPVCGTVSHVDAFRIRIDADPDTPEESVSSTADFTELSGIALADALRNHGADLPVSEIAETLIINAADIEQGITARKSFLDTSLATLEHGLTALAAVYSPTRTVTAVLKGVANTLPETETVEISEQYPSSFDPLVIKETTGKENPTGVVIVGIETLFQVGTIIESGLPALETMVTVNGTDRLVPVGTPVGLLMGQAGQTPKDRDRIVLGGVLSGTAAASPKQGVTRKTLAVSLVRAASEVALDAPCVGCGECVRHCPARLDPAMISSYAEFGLYDRADAESIDSCFECGLCGFFCIARRPMLQYIRLAKNELAQAKARKGEE